MLKRRWSVGLVVLCGIAAMHCLAVEPAIQAGGDPKASAAEEDEVREMQAKYRKEWLQRQADEVQRGNKLLEEEQRERETAEEVVAERLRNVDSLLREAWLGYVNYDARDREKVRQMFEEYLVKNPSSAFAPEIYYRIGSMYSNNANRKRGETFDRQTRDIYFTKAVDAYGRSYSPQLDAARSFVVSSGDQPLDARLAYYDWIIGFETETGPSSVYPICSIHEHVTYGTLPARTEQQIAAMVVNMPRILKTLVPATERLVLRKVKNLDELKQIIQRYPDRRIGQLAVRIAEQWERGLVKTALDAVEETVDSPAFAGSGQAPQVPSVNAGPASPVAGPADSAAWQSSGMSRRWTLLGLISGAGLGGLVLAAWVVKRRRRKGKSI